MGEVFKAQDTRLNRFVAVKVIANERQDAEAARVRFAAEARAIAALNHPHICALYDTGFEDGRPYLVMEYLEGETLADRLTRGALPIRDLLGLSIEAADALEYAHRHGIVHRDLKPANVFVARSQGAKLLDFGLAAMRGASRTGLAQLATEPVRVTEAGVIPGTLHYLAPERLDGRAADARSDIYALGAMLHEMLSGRRPFDAPTQARLISAILTEEPGAFAPPPGTPPELLTLIQVALCRNPDDRWQSAGDMARMLKGIASRLGRESDGTWTGRAPRRWPLTAAGLAVLAVVAMLLATSMPWRRREPPAALAFLVPPPARGSIGLTGSTLPTAQFDLAPDNHALVFVATADSGKDALWIRTFEDPTPQVLSGTEGASYPFWSPDSRHIGFFADQQLKRIPARGGPAEPLCPATSGRGGAWSPGGVIVFSANNKAPLQVISATGGSPTPLTILGPGHEGHRWPQFLPDGRHLIFLVKGSDETAIEGIYVTSLDAPAIAHRLRASLNSAKYAAGYLLYVSEGMLTAQRFDLRTLTLSGESVPLRVAVSAASTFYSAFSVVEGGALATWYGDVMSELTWYDRSGHPQSTVDVAGAYVDFRLSPDDSRLALAKVDPRSGTSDIWTIDMGTGAQERLTINARNDASPVWSPDGTRLVFRSNRHGSHELFERPARPDGGDQVLLGSGTGAYPSDWSRDGRFIVYHERHPATRADILLLDAATHTSQRLLTGPFEESQGQLSPDGRLAYTSDVSGEFNVFVGSIDGRAGQRISLHGGFDPRWREDGKELYFLDAGGMLTAVNFTTPAVKPVPLFPTRAMALASPFLSQYVPSRNGNRFLIKVPLGRLDSLPITVTMNWRLRLDSSQ
jgi:serine/threonine protein kinase